ncbi:unnamed protein product [Blumeria hordei]|uniref:Uncharacterized protein n=1 Tax=Blumeria hordei TaxID=2867405 RepID=A0A383UTN0_BLUHO|nr:unnamed protein product [Blumeria hordei]
MDVAMVFPYAYMAMCAENSPRPFPAKLINTPGGPYIDGTGAPLSFFTSAPFEVPAIVSTQLGTLENKAWPKSVLDLPRPFDHVDVRRKAKKAVIFFVEEFKIDNLRHLTPPTSLQDLFQGFDAVEVYMYGIEFCYYVMYYIGKYAQEYQGKMNQMIDSYTKNLVETNKIHLIQLPRANNGTEERVLHRNRYKVTEQMDRKEKDFFWERICHHRKELLDDEKRNPLKSLFDLSLSRKWPFPHDNRARSREYDSDARQNLEQNESINESDSPSSVTSPSGIELLSRDLFTNPMCRLELDNPCPEKYTRGSSFMVFNKCKYCARNEDCKETLIVITESNESTVNNEWLGIPKPKLSTPLSSERVLSTPSSKRDPKSIYIPHVRSSDLVMGKSKIPRLMRPKSQATISDLTQPGKKSVKGVELKERKKIVTAVARQSKNIRKPNISVQSQKVSSPKPDKFKKTPASSGVRVPIKKTGQVNLGCQRKPWV